MIRIETSIIKTNMKRIDSFAHEAPNQIKHHRIACHYRFHSCYSVTRVGRISPTDGKSGSCMSFQFDPIGRAAPQTDQLGSIMFHIRLVDNQAIVRQRTASSHRNQKISYLTRVLIQESGSPKVSFLHTEHLLILVGFSTNKVESREFFYTFVPLNLK